MVTHVLYLLVDAPNTNTIFYYYQTATGQWITNQQYLDQWIAKKREEFVYNYLRFLLFYEDNNYTLPEKKYICYGSGISNVAGS